MHPANFRDVGSALGLWLEPSPIPAGRLFRGGRIDALSTPSDIGNPCTILNLRQGPDPTHLAARMLHLPAPDRLENYDTSLRPVARWVTDALRVLAAPDITPPIYLHCTSGRDRTGVIIAAVLLSIGIPRDIIVEEYMLSDGGDAARIRQAIHGLSVTGIERQADAERIRSRFCAAA